MTLDYKGISRNVKIPPFIENMPVTSIWNWAFLEKKLTSVTIPDSVVYIGSRAFERNNLRSITIPNRVTTIGERAFCDNKLTEVTIPNSVTTIEECAFMNNKLTEVTIPNNVKTIGQDAFHNNKLKKVTLSEGIVSIGYSAFSYNKLTGVTIPDSVTFLAADAFAHNKLTKESQNYLAKARADATKRRIAFKLDPIKKQYELANASRDKNDYTAAIAQYRQVIKLVKESDLTGTEIDKYVSDSRENLKLVWDKRIAENQNKYPVPFEGSWSVTTKKEEYIPARTEKVQTGTSKRSDYELVRISDATNAYHRRYTGTYTTEPIYTTVTHPAYTLTKIITMLFQFNGINYTANTTTSIKTENVIEKGTGTFYFDGSNIELEDGRRFVFRNGVISSSEYGNFTKVEQR